MTHTNYHIAQINVAHLLAPRDDPRIAEFVALTGPINKLAEESPAFVWRLADDEGENAVDIEVDADDPLLLLNMSVWESLEGLHDYTYKSQHVEVYKRRKEWFELPVKMHYAIWWIEAGHIPTIEEGLERLATLRENGPTPQAFSFTKRFSLAEYLAAQEA